MDQRSAGEALMWKASKQRRSLHHQLVVIILELSQPMASMFRQSWVFFFAKKDLYLVFFWTCTQLTFGLSDAYYVNVERWFITKSIDQTSE